MLLINFLAYTSLYFARKPLSVVKVAMQDSLGISTGTLASIETAFLCMYAAGQIALPALVSRFAARQLLVAGYLAAGAACAAFGLVQSPSLLVGLWALNGLAQSICYPLHIKVLSSWFPSERRGRAMSLWATSAQVGGVASVALAAWALGAFGWRGAVVVPALVAAVAGLMMAAFLVEEPESVGLANQMALSSSPGSGTSSGEVESYSLGKVLRIPRIASLMVAYFFVKVLRYVLMLWLPFFLVRHCGMSTGLAAMMSCVFDGAGAFGVLATGALSDLVPVFRGRRTLLAAAQCALLAPALFALPAVSAGSNQGAMLIVALVGFLIAGPEAMLGSASAVDCCEAAGRGREAIGPAAGLVNAAGSVGAAMQGTLTACAAAWFGWGSLFKVLGCISALCVPALLNVARPVTRPSSAPRIVKLL